MAAFCEERVFVGEVFNSAFDSEVTSEITVQSGAYKPVDNVPHEKHNGSHTLKKR